MGSCGCGDGGKGGDGTGGFGGSGGGSMYSSALSDASERLELVWSGSRGVLEAVVLNFCKALISLRIASMSSCSAIDLTGSGSSIA